MLSPEAFVRWLRLGVGAAFLNSKPTPPDPSLKSNSERLSHLEDPAVRTSLGDKGGVAVPDPRWRRGGNAANRLVTANRLVAASLALVGVYLAARFFDDEKEKNVDAPPPPSGTPRTSAAGAKGAWRPVFDPGSNPALETTGASKFDKPSGDDDKSVMEHRLASDTSGRNLPSASVHQQDSVTRRG